VIAPIGINLLSNQISNFLGGPGPIYSGVPIAGNANPLTLQSARPVTGGYATQFATPTDMGCGCPDVVQPYDEFAQTPGIEMPVVEMPNMEGVAEECQTEVVQEYVGDCECQTCEEFAPCVECSDCGNCCDCGGNSMKTRGVLFRLKNWLHR